MARFPVPPRGDGVDWEGRFGRRCRPSYNEATECLARVHWTRSESRRAHLDAVVARTVTFFHRARHTLATSFDTPPCELVGCPWHESEAGKACRAEREEGEETMETDEDGRMPWWLASVRGVDATGARQCCSLWESEVDAANAESLAARGPLFALLVAHMVVATTRRITERVLSSTVWHVTFEWNLAQGLPHIINRGVTVFHAPSGLAIHPPLGTWSYGTSTNPSDPRVTMVSVGNFPPMTVHRDEVDGRLILENVAARLTQVPRFDQTPLQVGLTQLHDAILESVEA
jgi:hypothetical protein